MISVNCFESSLNGYVDVAVMHGSWPRPGAAAPVECGRYSVDVTVLHDGAVVRAGSGPPITLLLSWTEAVKRYNDFVKLEELLRKLGFRVADSIDTVCTTFEAAGYFRPGTLHCLRITVRGRIVVSVGEETGAVVLRIPKTLLERSRLIAVVPFDTIVTVWTDDPALLRTVSDALKPLDLLYLVGR